MEDIRSKKFWQHIGLATVGMLLFAMGINLFIVPADLYNGGLLGISQILRTLLVRYLHWFSGTTDIAGVINLLLNVPLFILAYISISKSFFARTLICVVSQTVFLSFIPIPTTPIVSDCLTASIIGYYGRQRYWNCFALGWFEWRYGYRWNVLYQEVQGF